MYLNNAKVTVVGTNLEVFTNQYGEYRIDDVPAGNVTLKVVFTGLEPATATVAVSGGQSVAHDFRLTVQGRTADTSDIVQLDEFVVANERETNAAAIAANEQRFSSNLKNVVSADAFGDVTEGNVGEFVKYLPGVTVDYVAADVRTISVRGFADNFTAVNVDGSRMASAASGSQIRTFELEQVSINNVSRVEVSKEPRPEDAADTLGGSVNLISKSAFESDRASLRYKAYLSFNNEDMNVFSKTPGPGEDRTYKVLPGFEFNYVNPISENLGIVVNGLSSNQFNEQHRSQPTWRFSGAGASNADPYLRQYQLQDGPKNTFRDSIGVKLDWKPARDNVLSLGLQSNYYKAFFGNRNLTWDVGSTNTGTGTGAVNLTFDPTFTHGATGRGSLNQGSSFRDKLGRTNAANLRWRFDRGDNTAEAGLNYSRSLTWYRDMSRGHFAGYSVRLQGVSRVNFDGISYPRPASITTLDASGNVIDPFELDNYRLLSVSSNPVDASDTISNAFVNLKHAFSASVPLSVKVGADIRHEIRDIRSGSSSWDFLGADHTNNSADDSAGKFIDNRYSGQDPSWGFPRVEYPDPYLLYRLFQSNPDQFRFSEVSSEQNRINGSVLFNEWVTSAYAQGNVRLIDNRLNILAGVRFEKTEDWGRGPLYLPDQLNGTPANAAQVRQVRIERGFTSHKSYSDYYPSAHFTFNITDNLLARFAYAKTLGRPDLSNIVPNSSIDEDVDDNDPNTPILGKISVKNSALKPWTADNWDASLEYYFPKGGSLSGGVFQKNLSDFFVTVNRPATQADLDTLGLDSRYLNWTLSTTFNGGDAKISGMEFAYNQPLTMLGEWGRSFNFQTNGTFLHLQGPGNAQFKRFIPKSGNVGLTYSKNPFIVMVKWNYRGRQRVDLASGNNISTNGYTYYAARANLDINFEYQFSKRFGFFANARNVLNKPQDFESYSEDDPTTSNVDETTPGYSHLARSEEFGIQWAVGIKGTF